MRRSALFAVPLVLLAGGAFALAATGGDRADAVDPAAANARTARASSVHYAVTVTLTERKQPLTLHISGGSSRDALSVRLRLDELKMKSGATVPGADARHLRRPGPAAAPVLKTASDAGFGAL
jgi:hypothetical protein